MAFFAASMFLIGLGMACLFGARTGFIYDDAFITFRYARNLATGAGFVYNPGERVLGTTSPLFTLILAGLHRLTGVEIPVLAVIAGGAGLGGVAVLLYLLLRRRMRFVAVWAAMALACMPYFVRIGGSGMEETGFLFLILLAYFSHVRRRPVLCGTAGFLAFLARPEGALWMIILLADDAVRREWSWRKALAFAIPAAGWLAFSGAYFGTLVPVNIFGKKLFFRFAETVGNTPRGEIEAALWGDAWAKLRTLAVLAGVAEAARRRARELVFAVFGACLLGALYWMNIFVFPWYWGAVYLIGMTFLAFAFHRLAEAAKGKWGVRAWAAAVLALFVATAWLEARKYRPMFDEYRSQEEIYDTTLGALAAAIHLDATGHAGGTIFAKEIGILGYETGLYVHDWGGLVSPQFHPLLAKKQLFEALQRANADYVVYPLPASETRLFLDPQKEAWFESHYRRVLRQPLSGRDETYDLFLRR